MTRPALRAAGALLCLSTLCALAAGAPVVPAPAAAAAWPAAIAPALVATSAALKEITAGQATMPYIQWLDTLPGFHFSPATSALLVRQFGTDHLFSVTRSVVPAGGRQYVLAVPTLRRDTPDGSSIGWSAMQGRMAVQPDGHTVVNTFSAPRIAIDDKALRVEASNIAYASTIRPNDNGLSFGEGIAELGSLEMTAKTGGAAMRMDGAFLRFGISDRGDTVDMFNDLGLRTLTVRGERIDNVHMKVSFTGLGKTALENLGKLGTQLPAQQTTPMSRAQYDAVTGPAALQLGMALMAPGAAIDLDELSVSYRGSKAIVHGRLRLEDATPEDLNQIASLFKKIVGHFDVRVPLAMVRAVADNAARAQLEKQQRGANAAAIASLGATIHAGLLRSATAGGYARVDADMLVTTIDIHDGVILLNGKPLPAPAAPQPVGAAGRDAGHPDRNLMLRARRIADRCTLPDFPADVVANDGPLSLALRMTVNADGTISKLMLARGSGLPAYDEAVLAAAAHCIYIPALRDGKPVAVPATWDIVRAPGSLRP